MTSPYCITPDHAYHLGSCCIFAELLRDGLWDIREKYILIKHLPAELRRCLNSRHYYHCHVGFQKLYDVYTSGRDIEKDDCDITVLYSILRNICSSLKAPQQGWGSNQKPSPLNIEIADDIERIRIGRNTFLGHVNKASMSKDEFEKLVAEVRVIVRRIDMFLSSNTCMAGLDQIEVDCKDLSKMKDYKKFNDMLEEQLTYERENRVKIAEAKKSINENKQKLERYEEHIAKVKKEINENKQELGRHEEGIVEVKRESNANKLELERHEEQIADRKKESNENKQELERHEEGIAEVKRESNANKPELERHEEEIAEVKKESNENKQELVKVNKAITSVKRKIEEGGQWKAKKRKMGAEKKAVKRKREKGGQRKAGKGRMSAEEEAGAVTLKEHIRKGYQKDLSTVFETSFFDGVSAIHMFSPIIIRQDLENQVSDNSPVRQGTSAAVASPILHHSGKVEQIQSYRDIFYKDEQLQTLIVLLGEAGVGKTTLCNHIVNLWCLVHTDDCQRELTENDQALIGVLKEFEYLFVVRCRDTKEHSSVLSMIKEMFCSGEYKLHIDTIFHCKTHQCLVIIDGLDEWLYTSSVVQGNKSLHVLPDCTNICGATVLMTSRPWKVEALPRNSLRDYRVLQLEGLDRMGINTLTNNFIKALEPSVTDHNTLCDNFLRQVYKQEMGDIVKQPLMLFSIIESWLSRNHKLHRSLTMNYAGLINSVLSHSDDKLSDKDKRLAESQEKESLPRCFTEMKTCLTYSGIIRKSSALAFETLVLKEKEMSLVFNKKDLIDEVGKDCLDLCLKLGILSETKTSSLARVKHVTLSFIHKSVQECFAAVHLSEDKSGLCLTQFTNKLTSLNEVFDLAPILLFLFGMSPSKGQTVLNHVYGLVDECSEIKAYRQCADCTTSKVETGTVRRRFHGLYVRCAVELTATAPSPTSKHTSSESNLCIPDVLIDKDNSAPDDVVHLLFCPGEHIKSLIYSSNNVIPCHVVESLECMTKVEKFVVVLSKEHLDKHIDLIIQSLPHLQQLQSFSLDFICVRPENETFKLSVPQSTRLFTELGKLTNLVSVALSCLDLTTVEKVELPKNLKSVYLFKMRVSSDLLVCMSCTEVHLKHLICYGDLVFPSTMTTLICTNVSCTGKLVFPCTCNTLELKHVHYRGDLDFPACTNIDCSDVYCTGNLVFPSTCTTLICTNVSCTGKLVFPSTCNTLELKLVHYRGDLDFPACTNMDCSDVYCTGNLVLPSTCNELSFYDVSCTGNLVLPSTCIEIYCRQVYCTGDLVLPSTCTVLDCYDVRCKGKLVFPLVCTELRLERMELPDLPVLPDSLTVLATEHVLLTQSAAEKLCRDLRSTSTLEFLSLCVCSGHPVYLHEHLDLSSCLSLDRLFLENIELHSCGVLVPHNVSEIEFERVTLSEEYWYQLVQNIYTCHNVTVTFSCATINEATLKYIRQHFIVTFEYILPEESVLTDEENTYITDEEDTDITDKMNDRIDENNDRTDKKENTHEDMLPDESNLTDEEDTYITDEKNDRTDEKNDKTDGKENDITDEKNDKTDETMDITDGKKDTIEERNDRTDEKNNRTDETDDKTDEQKDRTDEKENDRKDEDNGFTTVMIALEFHTKCPENK